MELYFYCKSSGSLPVEAYLEKTLLLLTLFKINTIKWSVKLIISYLVCPAVSVNKKWQLDGGPLVVDLRILMGKTTKLREAVKLW